MVARIYRPARNAMQSGKSNTGEWVLDFPALSPRYKEPLMGWTSTVETKQQIKLYFATKELAVAYAEREGLDYTVAIDPPVKMIRKSYSDNFRWGNKSSWTH